MPADDWPDLGGEMRCVPMFGIETELEIDPIDEGSVSCVGNGEEGAQLPTVERAPAVLVDAVQGRVKPSLEPIGDAERPFRGAIEGLIGNDRTWEGGRLDSARRVI